MSTNINRGDLMTQIVVEGCIPVVDGKPKGVLPVKGIRLTVQQRGEIGRLDPMRLTLDGETMLYPVGGDGVFLDMGRDYFTAWFNHPEARETLEKFEAGLKRGYPKARYMEECGHPDAVGMRVRFYTVELEQSRVASLEVAAPALGSMAEQFVVRVRGLIKPS